MPNPHSDALVFFGATGDLAYKKIFPALQSMVRHGKLDVPVIGVAKAGWTLEQLKARALDSLRTHGGVDEVAWPKLAALLSYVDGEYGDLSTFEAIRKQLGSAQRPAHYLAIPPVLFGTVVEQLVKADCATNARIIVEKPFGHDLQSAQELNRILHTFFDESAIFRIDHYLAKNSVYNLVSFRFSNAIFEGLWNRDHIESVQITMAEDFGVQGRGAFYDATGTIRDVVQNHIFQVLSNLTMEAPARNDSESLRDEKVKVLKSIPPVTANNLVRGQFEGYLNEPGVRPSSTTETFAALRIDINSWRWQGVPFFIRAGKNLPTTCLEVMARVRRPPITDVSPESTPQNYLRIRLNPEMAVAVALSATPATGAKRQLVELVAAQHSRPAEMEAYERVLSDAMAGDATLFARQDYVEEAWRIVDPVLKQDTPVLPYAPHTWGPAHVDDIICPPGSWHNPHSGETEQVRVVQPVRPA